MVEIMVGATVGVEVAMGGMGWDGVGWGGMGWY